MKRKISLISKIKIFWNWTTKQKNGVMVNCNYCKSRNIRFDKKSVFIDGDKYCSSYKCCDCGATCSNVEVWSKS